MPMKSSIRIRARASSQTSRAAPCEVVSPNSRNPAGIVHRPRAGSIARLHSKIRFSQVQTAPTTIFGLAYST
jgi:hypothetical protein